MGIEEFLFERAKRTGREEGLKEGIEIGKILKELERNSGFVKNLLTDTDLIISKIASLAGVSEDFVLAIKKELELPNS